MQDTLETLDLTRMQSSIFRGSGTSTQETLAFVVPLLVYRSKSTSVYSVDQAHTPQIRYVDAGNTGNTGYRGTSSSLPKTISAPLNLRRQLRGVQLAVLKYARETQYYAT